MKTSKSVNHSHPGAETYTVYFIPFSPASIFLADKEKAKLMCLTVEPHTFLIKNVMVPSVGFGWEKEFSSNSE